MTGAGYDARAPVIGSPHAADWLRRTVDRSSATGVGSIRDHLWPLS